MTKKPRILVIDDEKNIVDILTKNLERDGYTVLSAADGQEGVDVFLSNEIDLILLDCMMPKMDGYDVCKRIRQSSTVPIIMLTAKADEVDKVLGLELGADDYITKPFSVREVQARVKAHLRRLKYIAVEENSQPSHLIRVADLEIDTRSIEVRKAGKLLSLTLREFELLTFLASNPGVVFTRDQLLEKVWGYEYFGDARTVDVTVRRTREKLDDGQGSPHRYIMTKRGVGYYFDRGIQV